MILKNSNFKIIIFSKNSKINTKNEIAKYIKALKAKRKRKINYKNFTLKMKKSKKSFFEKH